MEQILLPETTLREAGAGPELSLLDRQGRVFLLTLAITRVLERESLELSVWGSEEGNHWGAEPLLRFPKKFFCGTYEGLLDLTGHPKVRYLRAKWDVQRWDRSDTAGLITLHLSMQAPRAKALAAA